MLKTDLINATMSKHMVYSQYSDTAVWGLNGPDGHAIETPI